MDKKLKIKEIANKYSFFAKDKKLYESGSGMSFDAKQWVKFEDELSQLLTPVNEVQSVEEIKKEFMNHFTHIHIIPVWSDTHSHEIQDALKEQIFSWFLPYLSRNSQIKEDK